MSFVFCHIYSISLIFLFIIPFKNLIQAEFFSLLTGIIEIFRIFMYKWANQAISQYAVIQNVILVLKIRVPLIRIVFCLQIHLGGPHEGEPR